MSIELSKEILERLESIYATMEEDYEKVAKELHFTCDGCPDNCCDSYFLHHTYIEWAYLWLGIAMLPEEKQEEIFARAKKYVESSEASLAKEAQPQIMCPLNENGLCIIYKYRLMVCRTHGVPALITRPDGRQLSFPGCFRCQEQLQGELDHVRVERTAMLRELALLENQLLQNRRHILPRVRMTIADMLVKGPPQLPPTFCGR